MWCGCGKHDVLVQRVIALCFGISVLCAVVTHVSCPNVTVSVNVSCAHICLLCNHCELLHVRDATGVITCVIVAANLTFFCSELIVERSAQGHNRTVGHATTPRRNTGKRADAE